MDNPHRLSLLSKIAYGLGDFASQLVWTFVGTYLTVYYTDVVGFAPAIAGAIMVIARVSDGVFDPLFGAIAERNKTRWGRFRPFILFGSPFLVILNILVFTSPFGHGTAGVIWSSVTYIVLGFLYSVVNLSYGSLSNVMTEDPQDRVELNSFRMIGTNLGSCFLSAISMPLILLFSGGNGQQVTAKGYLTTTAVLSICALPLFLLVFKQCKEVIIPIKDVRTVSFGKTFMTVFTNKPLMLLFICLLIYMTAMFGRIGLCLYYFMYNMHRFDLISLLMVAPTICAAISIFFTRKLLKFVSKKTLGAISLAGCGATLLALYFTSPSNVPLIIALSFIYGLFQFNTPLVMGSIPECIDYMEDKTGIRSDGASYAITSLATKISSAIGASLGLVIMGYYGYVANAQQSSASLMGINLVVNLLPAILFFITLVPWLLYPLNEQKSAEIRHRLDERAASRQSAA